MRTQEKHAQQKREAANCRYAVKFAPDDIKNKWGEVMASNSKKKTREFVEKWVGSPDWVCLVVFIFCSFDF